MRLIDADALIRKFKTASPMAIDGRARQIVNDMPTIEERKRGQWIPQDHNKVNGMTSTAVYYYPKCSVCGYCAYPTNFCPNCGADMQT